MLELLRSIQRRLDNVIARAKVTLVDDSKLQQRVQLAIAREDLLNDCERFQEYGFSSVPKVGAEAVVVFVGGRRDHPLVIALDDRRTRMKGLQAGEVCIYSDEGDYVIIRRGGNVEIKAANGVTVTSPNVAMNGNLRVDGDISLGGDLGVDGSTGIVVSSGDVAAGSVALKTHRHTGVQAGGSITGPPA